MAITGDSEHISALDGLRGVAILLVLLGHFDDRGVFLVSRFGWTGVDLFFVLSGFLITRILLRTKPSASYYHTFYARRALRIFPLYYGALFLLLIAFPHFVGADVAEHRWQFWSYMTNFGIVFIGWPPIVLDHFWSLAVEEHFYLVWPFVVRRFSERRLFHVGAATIVAVLLLRALLVALHVRWTANHYLTFCRADALIVGGLIAIVWRTAERRAALVRWAWRILFVTTFGIAALLVATHGTLSFLHWLVRTVGYTLLAGLYGALLTLTVAGGTFGRAVDTAPLRFLGKYSYGAYVLHMPVMVLLKDRLGPLAGDGLLQTTGRVATLGAVSLFVAYVSWHVFEQYFLRLKPAYDRTKPTLDPIVTSR